jgi:hypothetical protein
VTRVRSHLRARLGVLAIVSVASAYAFMGQDVTASQNAHLALVRALANGTAVIDDTYRDLGNIVTNDVDYFEGHYYAAKAPGLAFTTLPLFVILKEAGMRTSGDPARMLWALGLLGSVLPATLLLLLVKWVADQLAPGFGVAVAVALGLGTLLLPYASMFFAHALSAFLVFAAFALLWRSRDSRLRMPLVGLAGLAGGYAVTTEYQNAIAVAVLGVYAISRGDRLRRGFIYCAGVLVGMTPMIAYNWITFGSPLQFMQGYAATTQGPDVPDYHAMVLLLFWYWGLIVAAPVLAAGAFGTLLLFRRGDRAEALVIAAIAIVFVAYNSGVQQLSGGLPGTRYLVVTLPFLVLPLALAFQRLPLTTAALGFASVCIMVLMTASRPTIADDGHALERLVDPDGSPPTVSDFIGVTGWYDILPFYAFVGAALTFTVLATKFSFARSEIGTAVAALLAWQLTFFAASPLLVEERLHKVVGATALLALVAVLVAGVALTAVRFQRVNSHAAHRAPVQVP